MRPQGLPRLDSEHYMAGMSLVIGRLRGRSIVNVWAKHRLTLDSSHEAGFQGFWSRNLYYEIDRPQILECMFQVLS